VRAFCKKETWPVTQRLNRSAALRLLVRLITGDPQFPTNDFALAGWLCSTTLIFLQRKNNRRGTGLGCFVPPVGSRDMVGKSVGV
jgi:hypothetical protein